MPGYLCPGLIGITLIPNCVYAIAVSSVVIPLPHAIRRGVVCRDSPVAICLLLHSRIVLWVRSGDARLDGVVLCSLGTGMG